MSRRKNKQIPEEDIIEMEEFLNRRNVEEERLFQTISINVKCKTENQKKLVNSIRQNEITICSGLPGYMKSHHLQAGVGHYGVFNGKRWEAQIYPVVRNHIQSAL